MKEPRYKSERFRIRVPDEYLVVLNSMRGTIPLSTYLTDVVCRHAMTNEAISTETKLGEIAQ
jgi:hypothetical protein